MITDNRPIQDVIRDIILAWPEWSPLERSRPDDLVEEILDHVRNGTGNRFVHSWCERVLYPELKKVGRPIRAG